MSTVQAPLSGRSPLDLTARAESRNRNPDGQLYLRFQIPAERSFQSMAMRMGAIQEVLSLPVQRLSPMPNMPSCMLGLMNRGNRIFWLVDLGLLLGVSRLEPNVQQHRVMILRSGSAALGLAVSQVENMQWFRDEQLQPKPLGLRPSLSPYISGVLQGETGAEAFSGDTADPQAVSQAVPAGGEGTTESDPALVIEAEAILQAPILCSLSLSEP